MAYVRKSKKSEKLKFNREDQSDWPQGFSHAGSLFFYRGWGQPKASPGLLALHQPLFV